MTPKASWVGLLAVCGWVSTALAAPPDLVTVSVGTAATGAVIPADFVGMSFGMKTLLPDKAGGHFFSPTNGPLVTLFENLGIRHLRLGGTTVESPPSLPIPGPKEIDSLFQFVQTARVQKVIYSFRLLEARPGLHYADTNAALAKYIWAHYQPWLDCFAIGNEPDRRKIYRQDASITNFESYLGKWQRFAAAITNAVPQAEFAGPDAGSGNVVWTVRFAGAERSSGRMKVITEHFYAGGAGRGVSPEQGIETMLSSQWIGANQRLYERVTRPVLAEHLAVRFTEANDHYSGGVPGASDTFAGALWVLDFLHWWAEHGACGVDFHNTQWVVNDVISRGADHRLTLNPKGYGIKAFELSSRGRTEPASVSNPNELNLTAYAVRGNRTHWVTLINKEHGPGARTARVRIVLSGAAGMARMLLLNAPGGDAGARSGVVLGGSPISGEVPWEGRWLPVPANAAGEYLLELPAASAVVVEIPAG